ncbi:hypothetical protein SAV31267_013440 [Streptomyces avermitilis]|uniref:Uncharacterized protein n=1 Tax=Streptomyces avermitilis TaxID=33903 RepID=A0A4D4MK48_STRAX|nr:hypothetical protein SAV31267_013440 [Streptomyces avermitilis]
MKGIRRGTQYSHTSVAIRSAFARVAEAWIFHPWAGPGSAVPASSTGVNVSQSPIRALRHPSGTSRHAGPYSGAAPDAPTDSRSGVS